MPHVKPSREELEANIKNSLSELDNKPPEAPQPPATPPATPPVEPPVTPPATPPVEPPATPPTTPPATPPVTPPTEPVVDWQKKASESAREALVLSYKNRELSTAYEEAAKITQVTEDDMKKDYPEWEDMTDTEKKMAQQLAVSKRKDELINQAVGRFKEVEDWNGKVDTYVDDPKTLLAHPELEGKTEEFKIFAVKTTRRGMDLEDLVLAFNGVLAKTPPPQHKGEMFPSGTGGQKPATPQDTRLSVEQGAALMQTDYKRYKELLIAGQIKNE